MLKNVLASAAAGLLVFSPIAAQAGTRAASAGVSVNSLASVERGAAPVGSAEYQSDDEGMPTWLVTLLFGAVGAGIIYLVEDSENNKSPGT